MSVHHVQRHLGRIELIFVLACHFEHVEMNVRVFMSRKPDEAQFAGLASLDERRVRSFLIKDSVRVFIAQDFVMLNEVDVVGLQPLKRPVQLLGGLFFGAAIDLGHQEDFRAVAVAQGFTHPAFAFPSVVIPRIVQEIDASIHGIANDLQAQLFANVSEPEMPASQPNRGNFSPVLPRDRYGISEA